MAFTIPALTAIGTRLKTAFRAYLPGTDAWIEPNNLSVSSKAFALGLFDAYQRIAWLYRQLFASTADREHLVKRHAAEYGLTPKPSTAATGNVVILQAAGDDSELPVGLQLQRDDGLIFTVTAATAASNVTFVVPVQCTTTGADTNTLPGTVLAVLPMADVTLAATTGTVDVGGLGGGADAETTEALRARVLQRKRFTPMCGANSDYVRWALAVPGVTRAFASGFVNQPPGEVVYPLFDNTRPYGIPLQSDLDAVSASVETERPTAARVFYCAATPMQIDVTLADLDADTTANRTAIASQLAALFAARAAVSTADNPLNLRRGWIDNAVGRALGDLGYTLVAPAADVAVPIGSLPFLGQILYAPPDG